MRLFLPVRPTSTIRCGRSTSAKVTSRPAEAVAGRLHAEAGAGAAADRVDPRQVPVDQVVVGELGVVGDVLQVVEDLLARGGDDDRDGHGIHGAREVYWPGPRTRGRVREPRAGGDDAQAARAVRRTVWPCSAWRTARSPAAARAAAGRQSSQTAPPRGVRPRRGAPARPSAACGRSPRSSSLRLPGRRGRGAAARARAAPRRLGMSAMMQRFAARPRRSCRRRRLRGPGGCGGPRSAAGAMLARLRQISVMQNLMAD